jgi:endonuclease/exonuclease/phosphatase family metal-dependent hydrolase
VLGDFNDTEDSTTLQVIRGTGAGELFDTRPGEGGRATTNQSPSMTMQVAAWTNYWPESDRYERIDYLLMSQALRADWVASESYVLAMPNWKTASDHRPVVAAFRIGAE